MTYNVLIVDDSKLARMSVAKALSALQPSWNRLEAVNADDAIALARQTPIHVAMVDFNMPGRDGLELAAELRALNPAMPVAVISANHQAEIVTKAREVGATFLSKPVTEPALADFISGAVALLGAGAS